MSNRRRLQLFSGPKGPKENEIWYTTTDGQPITPSGFTIISNTYSGGIGKIVTSGKITSIPNGAFLKQTTLSSISMVWENITSIGSQAFRGCSNLHQDFYFANLTSLITLNSTASQFYSSGITGFDAPILTSVPQEALRGCTSLIFVNIPLVTNIGPGGFRDCNKLEEINMESVVTIHNYAFYSCSAMHQDLYLPKLTSMPASGTTTRHFYGSGITGFDAQLLTSIPGSCFVNCTLLELVNIPLVTNIGPDGFRSCRKFEELILGQETPPTLGSDALASTPSTMSIYVPDSAVDTYKAASGWSTYASRIKPMSELPTT